MLISLKALRRDRGGLQFLGSFMRAIFYIDGFNLYRSRLKRNRGYRWLNLLTLARRLVADEETVARVNLRRSTLIRPPGWSLTRSDD